VDKINREQGDHQKSNREKTANLILKKKRTGKGNRAGKGEKKDNKRKAVWSIHTQFPSKDKGMGRLWVDI